MGYWDRTDEILRENGGNNPRCPGCEGEAFPCDDHGRFMCVNCGTFDGGSGVFMSKPLPIPQVAAIEMSDAEKAKIPPLHRLHLTPTAAEARLLQIAAAGPAAMDDPAYWAASKAVDAERGKAAAGKQKKKKQKPPS